MCCFPCRSWWKAISQRFVGRVPSVGKSLRRCHGFVEMDAVGSLRTRPCSRPVGDTAGGRWRRHDPLVRRWASAMCDSSQRHSVTADYKSGNWLKSIDQMGSTSCTQPEKGRCWPCSPRLFLAPRPKEGISVSCKYRIILMFPPLTISDLPLQRCRHWIYISFGNLCFIVRHAKVICWSVLVVCIESIYKCSIYRNAVVLSFSSKRFRRNLK